MRIASGRRIRTIALLLLSPAAGLAQLADAGRAPITTVAGVRALSPDELEERRPVLLEGIITHFAIDEIPDFWLQDETAGLYIYPGSVKFPPDRYRPGTRIRLRGETSARTFAPGVIATSVEVLGQGELPPPAQVSLDELIAGNREGELVEIEGVVREVTQGSNNRRPQWVIRFARDRGRLIMIAPLTDPSNPPLHLIDAGVKVKGVMNAYRDLSVQSVMRVMRLTSLDDIEVVNPAPADPFDRRPVSIRDLTRFIPGGLRQNRVRVRGTVTLSQPGSRCFLEDGGTGLQVVSSDTPAFEPGEIIEVAGFPAVGDTMLYLENPVYRREAKGPPPEPARRSLADLARRYSANCLVRTVGTLSEVFRSERGYTLLFREGSQLLRAEVPLPPGAPPDPGWVPESRMEITGVCMEMVNDSVLPDPGASRPVLHLLSRGPQDVVVLDPAPWWNPERLRYLVVLTVAALAGVFAWVALLRRQVRRRTRQLSDEIRARLVERAAWSAVRIERQRLAAELHDGIEQLIASAAWQIASAASGQAGAENHLHLARRMLNRCREELRRSVWDLRAESLDRGDLTTALRENLKLLADRHDVPVELTVRGEPAPLAPLTASALLRIAQESVSNALRHGAPSRVDVSLDWHPDRLTLRIRDDGRGFDPFARPGVQEGHFGITGMEERARRVGAKFEMDSRPGHGTTVRVCAPVSVSSPSPELQSHPSQ